MRAAAKKAPEGDPRKALQAVYDDPAFSKLSSKAQQAVLSILNP